MEARRTSVTEIEVIQVEIAIPVTNLSIRTEKSSKTGEKLDVTHEMMKNL